VPSEVGGNVSKADESGEKVADTSMELEPRPPVKDSTNGTSPIETSSKKRGREEDEIPEGEGSAKKVDIKGGAS